MTLGLGILIFLAVIGGAALLLLAFFIVDEAVTRRLARRRLRKRAAPVSSRPESRAHLNGGQDTKPTLEEQGLVKPAGDGTCHLTSKGVQHLVSLCSDDRLPLDERILLTLGLAFVPGALPPRQGPLQPIAPRAATSNGHARRPHGRRLSG